tara:strand:- start:288 stop:1469 length:1182 start_codon:yes stop_codon:yes gene_type:complete
MSSVSLGKICQISGTTGLFVIISSPSLKLIYSSQIINLIGLFLLLTPLFFKFNFLRYVSNYNSKFFYSLFFILLLFLGYFAMFEFSNLQYVTFFRYFYWIASLTLIVLNSRYINVKWLINLILYWSITLAFLKIFELLNPDRSLGQHYLTIGLPLGAGLTVILITFFNQKNHGYTRKLFHFLSLILIIYALLISMGRSNIIFPFFTLFCFLLIRIAFGLNRLKSFFFVCFFVGLISGFYYYIELNSIDFQLVKRMGDLNNDDSSYLRVLFWKRALGLFTENIFGLGVESHQNLFGVYPHNIFIEVLFSFGIIGGLLVASFVISFFRYLIKISIMGEKNEKDLNLGYLGVFFFISWNTSFDFATSYIPFGVMLLFCVKSNSFKNKKEYSNLINQ